MKYCLRKSKGIEKNDIVRIIKDTGNFPGCVPAMSGLLGQQGKVLDTDDESTLREGGHFWVKVRIGLTAFNWWWPLEALEKIND